MAIKGDLPDQLEGIVAFTRSYRMYPELWLEQQSLAWGQVLHQKFALDAATLDLVAREASPFDLPQHLRPLYATATLNLLGLRARPSYDQAKLIFERVLVPWMLKALDDNDANLALWLELAAYMDFVERIETAEHYQFCFGHWLEPMRTAGLRAAAITQPLNVGQNKLAILAHYGANLGHIEMMMQLLAGLKQSSDAELVPLVIWLQGCQPAVCQRLESLGIEQLDGRTFDQPQDLPHWFKQLKIYLNEKNIGTLVWNDNPMFLAYASAMRLAPRQILWGQKFAFRAWPDIDQFLANGYLFAETMVRHGVEWQILPNQYQGLYQPELAEQADLIKRQYKEKFPDAVILGTIAREQKINSLEFLQLVTAILENHPNAIFLYTGRSQPELARTLFEKRGLAERALYVGWVNSALYAQVLDIFLDSFPAGNGQTLLEAMASGCPAIFLQNEQTLSSLSVLAIAGAVLAGREGTEGDREDLKRLFTIDTEQPLLAQAYRLDEYQNWAERLITNPTLRRKVGQAGRKFSQKYFSDPKRLANAFARAIR